jgi:hypothetical protein
MLYIDQGHFLFDSFGFGKFLPSVSESIAIAYERKDRGTVSFGLNIRDRILYVFVTFSN